MAVHDWTRVDAGTFHAFHTCWIGELMGSLNSGLLPAGYYALAEAPPHVRLSVRPTPSAGSRVVRRACAGMWRFATSPDTVLSP